MAQEAKSQERGIILPVQIGRAIAALMVVLAHTNVGAAHFYGSRPFGDVISQGRVGVDFFFVLSGFIIFYAHHRDPAGFRALRSYAAKRAARIYPPYWPIGIAMLLLGLFLPQLSEGGVSREPSILSSLFLVPSQGATSLGPTALIVAWTLVWEVMFYTIFSLFFLFRRAFPWLLATWGAAVLIAIFAIPEAVDGRYWSPLGAHNIEFLAGIGVAALVGRAGWIRLRAVRWPAGFIGLAMVLSGMVWVAHGAVLPAYGAQRTLYFGAAFALVLLCISQIQLSLRSWAVRFFVFLGSASYAIYLAHDPTISVLNRLARPLAGHAPAAVLFVAVATFAVMAGCIYHMLIERPLIAWFGRQLRVRPARAVTSYAAGSAADLSA